MLSLAGIQMESRSEVECGTWIAIKIAKSGLIAELLGLRLVRPLQFLLFPVSNCQGFGGILNF